MVDTVIIIIEGTITFVKLILVILVIVVSLYDLR